MKKTIASIAALAALFSITPAIHAADNDAPKKGRGFAAADTNGNGTLDLAEFTAMVSKRMDAEAAKKRFAELDKDGNGELTLEEFRAGRKARREGGESSKPAPN